MKTKRVAGKTTTTKLNQGFFNQFFTAISQNFFLFNKLSKFSMFTKFFNILQLGNWFIVWTIGIFTLSWEFSRVCFFYVESLQNDALRRSLGSALNNKLIQLVLSFVESSLCHWHFEFPILKCFSKFVCQFIF